MNYFIKKLLPFTILYLVAQSVIRLSIFIFEYKNISFNALILLKTFTSGILFDVSSVFYFLIPFSILIILVPKKLSNGVFDKTYTNILFTVAIFSLIFEGIAVWTFWLEFNAMFNFIAVDYLVYTIEVLKNIYESYPVVPILVAAFFIALLISFLLRKKLVPNSPAGGFLGKIKFLALLIILCSVSFFGVKFEYSEVSNNSYNNELAQSPLFSLFHAYNVNEINYQQFYLTQSEKTSLSVLKSKLQNKNTTFIDTTSINRIIKSNKKEIKANVVIVLMESMEQDYLRQSDKPQALNITPNLSFLADNGIWFKYSYATGTRTVRGIEATTLSVPPLPGQSIVRRPENGNLNGLGNIFKSKGYNTQFIYGGYSRFDNMKDYFENNGFSVVDRTDIKKEDISMENVWGVDDESLFKKVIFESNKLSKLNKPFMQYVLTTSNHRPYTYPNGKIDIPSKTGRLGAVKYSDYAIGYFMKEAAKTKWYKNTIFVFVGDHEASVAGKEEVNRNKYPVVLIFYSPNKNLIPKKLIKTPISQIDLAPTLLGLLNFNYTSSFFGQDFFNSSYKSRYIISNYEKVAYVNDKYMIVLKPNKKISVFDIKNKDKKVTNPKLYKDSLLEAISYFQTATNWKKFMKLPISKNN